MIDDMIYELVALKLKAELGDLDDFPPEIQNTVSNVYYRHVQSVTLQGNFGNMLEDFRERSERNIDGESIGEHMKAVRKIREEAEANDLGHAYDYVIILTLDIYKYRIKDAEKKTPIRRLIERKFKSPKEEIPNLYQKIKNKIFN